VLGSAVCLRLVRHLDHRAATQRAAALFGASQAWVDVYGHGPFDDAGRARTTAQDVAYVQAGPERFSAGLATRRSCDYHRAMTEAETAVQELLSLCRAPLPGGLTKREVEVLRSVADGLSNTEIATRLTISPRTSMRICARSSRTSR
jgi:DNA-binding NarL/FixJ family response regulator